MRLEQSEEGPAHEPRYDPETAGKVAALASRLQSKHQETLSARELEAIGAEVGLKPSFIREACGYLQESPARASRWEGHRRSGYGHCGPLQESGVRPSDCLHLFSPRTLKAIAGAWWAAGWTLPLILVITTSFLFRGGIAAAFFFLGWAIYIGGGVLLSHLSETEAEPPPQQLPRAQLLEMLFALQGQLEGQKQHRAFLSVDVVDSSEMKRLGPDLAVEYSFGQFHRWVEEIVREEGGEMQSAAGDGVMCLFPTQGSAVRTARRLQEGIDRFNATRNRLGTPFRLRCGISAGAAAIEEGGSLGRLQSPVIDCAAALQKRAAPGDIVVAEEAAEAALKELGALARLPEPIAGVTAFSWHAWPGRPQERLTGTES